MLQTFFEYSVIYIHDDNKTIASLLRCTCNNEVLNKINMYV